MVSARDAAIKMRRLARVSMALWLGSIAALLAMALLEQSWPLWIAVSLFVAERCTMLCYDRLRRDRPLTERAVRLGTLQHYSRCPDDAHAKWRDDTRFVERDPRWGG